MFLLACSPDTTMPSALEMIGLPLHASQIEDLRLASSMLSGEERRAFQVAMALKYCEGNARQAERVFAGGAARRCNWAYTSTAPGSSVSVLKRPSAGIGFGKSNTRRLHKRCGP